MEPITVCAQWRLAAWRSRALSNEQRSRPGGIETLGLEVENEIIWRAEVLRGRVMQNDASR